MGHLHLGLTTPPSRFSPFPLLHFSRLVVSSRVNPLTYLSFAQLPADNDEMTG